MTCTNPYKLTVEKLYKNTPTVFLNKDQYPLGYLELPCGHCIACKIQRSREWTLRIVHELEFWEHASFVTLTYDDKHLPKKNTLVKSDLQKFFKRLRKKISPIKYYACGEYGERGGRPHYHMILFGIKMDLDTIKEDGTVKNSILNDTWDLGLIHAGTVTADSARYVTGYIDKKYNGSMEDEIYTQTGRINPFQICSQGLGLRFALREQEQLKKNLYTTLKGAKIGLPKYYKKKLNIDSRLYEARSIQRLINIYTPLDQAGLSLDEANLQISLSNKQKARTVKTKTEIKNSQYRRL